MFEFFILILVFEVGGCLFSREVLLNIFRRFYLVVLGYVGCCYFEVVLGLMKKYVNIVFDIYFYLDEGGCW